MSGRPISEDDLHAFVDRALTPARATEVTAYLADHPEVTARIADYASQREALQAAFAPIAEEPLPPELNLAHLVAARRRPLAPSWRAAAAAILLLCGGLGGGWFLRALVQPSDSGVAALARETRDNYTVYASDHVQPVEMAAAETARFVAWASERLDHPVVVPDLATAGYRFMGGRLVATTHGAAILLMYDDDHGARLVMLTRPMADANRPENENAPMTEHVSDGVAGFTWVAGGIGYGLVGSQAPETLHPIADEMRRQIGA